MKNGSCAIKEIKVGSRPSPLAKIQVQEIIGLFPAIDFQIQYTDSMGDKDRTKDLMSEGIPQDFFTREIDQLILRDMVDIGVHSAKDLPEVLPRGLEIFAITQGKNPGDSLVGPAGYNLDSLPQSAKVGTSSLRRKTQLLKIRPDLEILPIRGNIHERIQLTRDNLADAVVVATCALERLGLDSGVSLPLITHPLQGFLAVVGREEEQHLKDIFSPMDVRKSWGSVGLVGAGPGDPSLMTIQGRKVLEEADEVFYDALLDPRQLRGLKASLKYVGKRKGEHSYAQERIQDFMIRSAQAGRQVVRLKGGDPFVFGRGGEEVLALREARLNYRVVPGVSSALGAAAYLDLPLTQRNVSSSLAFSMGYPPEEIRVLNVDSQAVFMGRSNIGLFAQQALAKGYGPQTSLVLVENATWPQQRRIELSLEAALNYRHDSSEPVLVILSRSSEVFTGPSWFERQRKSTLYRDRPGEVQWARSGGSLSGYRAQRMGSLGV
jgi:uroporphyrinogen III methyltransferase/synthase